MIIGKSIHPVEIKKIFIEVWSLRDEIEATLRKRVEEQTDKTPKEVMREVEAFYGSPEEIVIPMEEVTTEDSQKPEDEPDSSPEASNEDTNKDIDLEKSSKDEDSKDLPLTTSFTIKPTNAVKGYTLLADINMDQILLFSETAFTFGQSIVMEFQIPNKFKVYGEVLGCNHIAKSSRVISEFNPHYRVSMKIHYKSEESKSPLRDFLHSVEPTIPSGIRNIEDKDKKSSNDEIDDLDDLDL